MGYSAKTAQSRIKSSEFADVSCAMRYHVGLAMGPTVDAATMAAAIQNYQDFLAGEF